MTVRFILSDYVEQAMAEATYDKLEDGMFAGRIPPCPGLIAFGETLRLCEDELRSTLEDWILVGLKLGHPLPVLAGIDLNHHSGLVDWLLSCPEKGYFVPIEPECSSWKAGQR